MFKSAAVIGLGLLGQVGHFLHDSVMIYYHLQHTVVQCHMLGEKEGLSINLGLI
jgi:hypothetical protein